MARKITEDSIKKGFVARVLGSQPTVPQEIYFWCMVLSTLCWPVVLFVTIFFFDAPIRSTIDGICRWGYGPDHLALSYLFDPIDRIMVSIIKTPESNMALLFLSFSTCGFSFPVWSNWFK